MPDPLRGAIAIAGAAESRLGEVGPGVSPLDLIAEATAAALEDAGLRSSDVDGLFTASAYYGMPGLNVGEALSHPPALQRLDEPRRRVVRQPPAARRGRDRSRAVRGRADHVRQHAALRRRALEVRRRDQPARGAVPPALSGLDVRARGRAPHARVRHDARAARRGRGRGARVGAAAPERLRARPAEHRGRARQPHAQHAADRARLLPRDRRRRRADRHAHRARARPAPPAGRAARRGRGALAALDRAAARHHDDGRHRVRRARVRDGRRGGPRTSTSSQLYDAFTINTILFLEDLGFCAKGEGGPFVAGGRDRARRAARRQHERRRPVLHAPRHVRDLPARRGRAPAARRGRRAPAGRRRR